MLSYQHLHRHRSLWVVAVVVAVAEQVPPSRRKEEK